MKDLQRMKTWQIVFITIGIVSSAALILNLFILGGPAKKDLYFEKDISVKDSSLLHTLSDLTNTEILKGGEIEILNNGDEFYPALYSDIENAKSSIEFSAYIWKPGVVSDKVFELLTKKASEGVKVRLIIDGFGGKTAPKEDIEKLKSAGAQVEIFHPLKSGKFTKFHKRNHARSIIIDNQIGFIGGMAVADYWLGNAEDEDHWRDMMFKVDGPLLSHIQNSFAVQWEVVSGEILVFDDIDNNLKSSIQSISLTSFSPDEDTQQLSTFFSASIVSAKESVIVATPYMILNNQTQKALVDTAQRGVDVSILLPGEIIDSKVVQTASQHYFRDLLKSGVKIYEYSPTMLHSKAMVIDGTWSIIGSSNIDSRSNFYNVENLIGIQDESFGQKLTTVLKNDIANSRQISEESWRRRSIFRKIFEPTVYIFDKQF